MLKLILLIIQCICLCVQIVCLISCEKNWKEIDSMYNDIILNKPKNVSSSKKLRKGKFYFCQWLALHCKKSIVIVYGRRRSGKTYTALKLMAKQLNKGNNVGVLTTSTCHSNYLFHEAHYFIKQSHWTSYCHELKLSKSKNKVNFYSTFDIEEAYKHDAKLPDILIVDEIEEPMSLVMQADYLHKHRNWNFKKIFIVTTPLQKLDKEHIYRCLGKGRTKVFRWGIHCGPKLPKEIRKEIKRTQNKRGCNKTFITYDSVGWEEQK